MSRYTEKQIEDSLAVVAEYHGFAALQKITAKFQISNPAHFDGIAAMLKTEFNIDASKGSVSPTFSGHDPLKGGPEINTHNVVELDAHRAYADYNRRREPRFGPVNFHAQPGESLREVKDE
jgi:hypothetical protein